MILEKKRWLVTGVAGFIGSHLLEALLKADQTVIGLDNFITGKRSNIDDVLGLVTAEQARNFTFVEGDIRSFETCQEVTKNVNYVLNQAALGSVPRSVKDPITTNDINVTGFLNILRASELNKVSRFVYASSSSVYGDSEILPKQEDILGAPLSPYAVSKRVNELYADAFFRSYNMEVVGLRYFNVFGPRQDPESMYAAVIPLWVKSLLEGSPCYINGDGKNSRDFCYIENVVQANINAALTSNKSVIGQVFNVAFGESTNLLQLFDMLKANLDLPNDLNPVHREPRIGDVKHSLADIQKAKSLLGYAPEHSISSGLKITTEWFKNAILNKTK